MTDSWMWSIAYHKDQDHLILAKTPDRYVLATIVVCRVWDSWLSNWVLAYIPGYCRAMDKLILWLDSKEKEVYRLPLTQEMLREIAPNDEWLWSDESEETEKGTQA